MAEGSKMTERKNFKVGDKVRVVGVQDDADDLVGKVGKVVKVDADDDYNWEGLNTLVKFEGWCWRDNLEDYIIQPHDCWWFEDHNIEVVQGEDA
jgi:hypothetical protein